MQTKMHPADIADRAKIATATHFNVHLRRSPTSKINREAPTLVDAAKIAEEIATEFGKAPMIYAVTPDQMTIFVPKDLVEAAKAKPEPDEIPDCVPAFLAKEATARKAAIAAREDAAENKIADQPAAKGRKSRASAPKSDAKASGKLAAAVEAAKRGELPAVPDFSAATHTRFRAKLAKLVELANAGDVDGLRAFEINPISSSPKAMNKYRNLAVVALEARAGNL